MDERGLTVVPERLSAPRGGTIDAVILTNNVGQRFRMVESGGKLTLEEDTSPRELTPTWLRVESAQATLRSTLAAMLEVMKREQS
jgi:hypothetical protein